MHGTWNRRNPALVAAVALGAIAALPVGAGPKTATFNVTAVRSGTSSTITIKSQVWVTATQARADVQHPIQGQATVLISNGVFYQLDRGKKRGVKKTMPAEMRNSKDNFDFLVAQFAFEAKSALKGAKKVRTETVAGYPCDVFTNSMTKGPATRSVTVWMPQKMSPRFPLKAIMKDKLNRPGAVVNESTTVTLSNVKVGQAIPASVFNVPTGFNIVDGDKTPPRK